MKNYSLDLMNQMNEIASKTNFTQEVFDVLWKVLDMLTEHHAEYVRPDFVVDEEPGKGKMEVITLQIFFDPTENIEADHNGFMNVCFFSYPDDSGEMVDFFTFDIFYVGGEMDVFSAFSREYPMIESNNFLRDIEAEYNAVLAKMKLAKLFGQSEALAPLGILDWDVSKH